jgi:hypothetical protein
MTPGQPLVLWQIYVVAPKLNFSTMALNEGWQVHGRNVNEHGHGVSLGYMQALAT